jgi:hypothetical protein
VNVADEQFHVGRAAQDAHEDRDDHTDDGQDHDV